MSGAGKVLRAGAGTVLLGAGVIGILLPVIPGVPLILAGAALLGPDHPLVRRVTDRAARWRGRRKEPR